jgi:hypothetical protein
MQEDVRNDRKTAIVDQQIFAGAVKETRSLMIQGSSSKFCSSSATQKIA